MKLSAFFTVLLLLTTRSLLLAAPEAAGSSTAAAAQSGPAAGFELVSVKEIGPLLAPRRSSSPVVGQAGNYSMALENGRSLWFLNNIWTGELKDKGELALWGIVDGGLAVLEATSPYSAAGNFMYVADENKWPLPVLTADLSEYSAVRKFWPRAGVRTVAGSYVYYSLMNNFGPAGGDYFRVGQGLAEARNFSGPYKPVGNSEHYALWNDIAPAFGSALWLDRDGWLYVYGRQITEPGKPTVALARVRPEDIAAKDKYLYYTLESASDTWTTDIAELTPVMDDMPDEFSVAFNDHLKEYLALYFDQEAGEVVVKISPYPWGPWEASQKVLACAKEEYCFGAKEQAIFAAEGGKKIFFTLEKKNMPYLYEVSFK